MDPYLFGEVRRVDGEAQDAQSLAESVDARADGIADVAADLADHAADADARFALLHAALAGDIVFALEAAGASFSAAYLNAAAAGTARATITATLKTGAGALMGWVAGMQTTPVGDVGVVADGDIGAPVIDPLTPTWDGGAISFDAVLDTDEGATKTWQAGDEQTVEVPVNNDGQLAGKTLSPLTFTITVT